jgi:hypothetical protein
MRNRIFWPPFISTAGEQIQGCPGSGVDEAVNILKHDVLMCDVKSVTHPSVHTHLKDFDAISFEKWVMCTDHNQSLSQT